MLRDENDAYLMGAAEALLFVSDEPVSAAKMASFLDTNPGRMDEILQMLACEYEEENRGMQLREVAGGWRLFSHPAYHDLIESYVLSWDTRRLSQAALEALAVVAYHQPVSKAGINAVRGVNSEGVLSSLIEKGLVKEVGREKAAGAAILYGTTRAFLEKFGLKTLKDLPPLEDFAPDEESRQFIRERLSGGPSTDVQYQLDMDEEGEDALSQNADGITLVDEGGAPLVQEVDRGEGPSDEDPQALAAIIDQAITSKVDFEVELNEEA